MNTAIIMLGSNINARSNIDLAINKLIGCFVIINKSLQHQTEPIGLHRSMNFYNMAVKLMTNKTLGDTVSIFKLIELEMGRRSGKLTSIIPIDIDLIFWNDNLIHEDYNRFEYVKSCVNEIK